MTNRNDYHFNAPVGSLTRLMVKTYNDDKAARGSGRTIQFTDFGNDADNNMMLVHKPARRSTGGKAPRKESVMKEMAVLELLQRAKAQSSFTRKQAVLELLQRAKAQSSSTRKQKIPN